jgi:hypothetical protein
MEKKKFEEICKKCLDWMDKGKTFDEIGEQLRKELSDKEFEEFPNLIVKKTHEYLKKSKGNEK